MTEPNVATEQISHYYADDSSWTDALIGHSIETVAATDMHVVFVLDDGTQLLIGRDNSDCCSWIEVKSFTDAGRNVITSASVMDTDEGEGEYRAWVNVVTDAGPFNIIDCDADATNGCYLHGFALDVTVVRPSIRGAEVEQ